MVVVEDDGLEIDTCPVCSGLWFDAEELRRFLPSPRLAEKVLAHDRLQESVQREPRAAEATRLCPQCQKALRESPVGEIQVDVCSRCRGIWLDRGELSRALALYKVGERGNLVVLNQIAEGLRARGGL